MGRWLLRGSPMSSTSTPCHMLALHAPWILHYLVRSCEMEYALSMEDPRYGVFHWSYQRGGFAIDESLVHVSRLNTNT
jgi:hypothetical protein